MQENTNRQWGMRIPSLIYFRTRMGMDYRVWLTLAISVVLTSAVLAFRIATVQPCPTVHISVKGTTDHSMVYNFYTGELLTFGLEMTPADPGNIEWDMGDGSPKLTGKTVSHKYQNEGYYMVTMTINGRCRQSLNIRVNQMAMKSFDSPPVASPLPVSQIIDGKDYVTAGELAVYQTDEPASAYEWIVENDERYPIKSGPQAAYSFIDAGQYVIRLTLDNDPAKMYRKTVMVTVPSTKGTTPDELPPLPLPAPRSAADEGQADEVPGQKPVEKNFEVIPDQIFKDNFQALIDGTGTIEDITRYLCEGLQTKVRANGKTYANLGLFAEELKGKKGVLGLGGKKKVKSVNAKREVGSNCVYWLDISYK